MRRRARAPDPAATRLRPHDDLDEPDELPTAPRDVAHMLLELRATLDEIPSSSASDRARQLVRDLLAREAQGPSPAGEERWPV